MRFDLHVHTNQSDGSFTPEQVVDLAIERGIKLLAITDHDATSGVEEAVNAGRNKGLKIVHGTEISCCSVACSKEEVHIVGLNIDINSQRLKTLCRDIAIFKKLNTQKELELVNKYFNSNITFDDLQKKTKGTPVRRHIGMALLDKGYVKDIKEGIKLVANGGSCSANFGEILQAKEAIEIIHEAGGIAILAHVAAYKNKNKFVSLESQEELIKELASYGLDGVEVYIPESTKEEKQFGLNMAQKYNLFVSGGSDFHDEALIPKNKLGFLDMLEEELPILRKLMN